MKQQTDAFFQFLQQIRRDAMLFAAIFAPFLAGAFIRWGVPFAENQLTDYFMTDAVLAPYYLLFDIMLSMMTPVMFGFVGGIVILGELDEHVAIYLAVTPLTGKGYLVSRLFLPVAAAGIFSCIVLPLFHISPLSIGDMGVLICGSLGLGLSAVLLIVSLSHNKVEGMAIGKLVGIVLLGAFVPFFIASPIQYAASFLPSFWLGSYFYTGSIGALAVGAVLLILWIFGLGTVFLRRLSKA